MKLPIRSPYSSITLLATWTADIALPDLVLFAFTAEIGSKSGEALNLLARWAATESRPIAADTSDRAS